MLSELVSGDTVSQKVHQGIERTGRSASMIDWGCALRLVGLLSQWRYLES